MAGIDALCRQALGAAALGCEPMPAGLGARRFFRVALEAAPHSLIARCELPEDPALRPAGVAPEPPLEPIRSLLERAGLPVPRCYAASAERGIELLEDLGDTTLDVAVRGAGVAQRRALYARACSLVPRLQALEASPLDVPNFGRHLDAALFAYKAEQVCQWLVPCATGKPATAGEREVVAAAFGEIEAEATAAPQRLSHRDFKAQNLHVVPAADASSPPRLVMIDLQGAFLAPPEYDLVCLLRDLQSELEPEEIREQREAIRPALPDVPERTRYERRFELLTFLPTGVRHLKAAGSATCDASPALARFADLIAQLPESPCAP
jgi:aminoglycoside/choline kinase family phosphotransferase